MNVKEISHYLSYAFYLYKKQGIRVVNHKVHEWYYNKRTISYKKWITLVESQQKKIYCVKEKYSFGIIVPLVLEITDRNWEESLKQTVDSIENQTYSDWKIYLVINERNKNKKEEYIKRYQDHDKLEIVVIAEAHTLADKIKETIKNSTEDYIGFVRQGDWIATNALGEMASMFNQSSCYDMIYSDEDEVIDQGERIHPWMKPDWSPDTLMNLPYIEHLAVYRTRILQYIELEVTDSLEVLEYDLALQFTERTNRIGHISKVLYHRKQEEFRNDMEEIKRVKENALKRRGLSGVVELIPESFASRIFYFNQSNPLVSIIILSKDNDVILKQCLDSIFQKTKYSNYEILIVDNGSKKEVKQKIEDMVQDYIDSTNHGKYGKHIRYEYCPMPFNYSKLCNLGASRTVGEYLVFLNDDIEIETQEWIERMLGQASLEHVGGVGCKLLYPNSTCIQHDGIINLASGPAHALQSQNDKGDYEYCRNKIDRNYLAVTGACLMISRKKFEQIQGYKEELPVAYNDVELCLNLFEQGYFNVVRNDVVLYHHEAISRKDEFMNHERLKQLKGDLELVYSLHPKYKGYDPFYNSNLNYHRTDFSLGFGQTKEARRGGGL